MPPRVLSLLAGRHGDDSIGSEGGFGKCPAVSTRCPCWCGGSLLANVEGPVGAEPGHLAVVTETGSAAEVTQSAGHIWAALGYSSPPPAAPTPPISPTPLDAAARVNPEGGGQCQPGLPPVGRRCGRARRGTLAA